MLNAKKIRADFPFFKQKLKGKPLAYLDNAATTQKPRQVLDAMQEAYVARNANPYRGAYALAVEATEAYERAREKVADFIGADPEEVIFTRNATDSLNIAANLVCASRKRGSTILLTEMEHHSNLVSWQLAAKRWGHRISYVKVKSDGHLCREDLEKKAGMSPLVFSFVHVSNVLGTVNNAKQLSQLAHENGSLACIDAAQSVPHMSVDVQKLNCDFLAFSGHKMLGPAGIGVLYMKKELQEEFEPLFGGGEMIKKVSLGGASWNDPPHKFEPGTPNLQGAVGLAAAIDYLMGIGMENVERHCQGLAAYCRKELEGIGAQLYGPVKGAGIVSFNVGNIHPHDVAHFADKEAVAIRSGHHCAQPLMNALGIAASCRASFYVYNDKEEVDRLASAVSRAAKALG